MPFLDTLVNAYSLHEDTVEFTVKALFGEALFQGHSPVEADPEENDLYQEVRRHVPH